MGDAEIGNLAGVACSMCWSPIVIEPESIARRPTIASTSSVWPLPWTPAMSDDLAGPHVEVDAVDGHLQPLVADPHVAEAEDDLAGLGRAFRNDELDVAADHQVGQLLAGRGLGVGGAGDAPAAQDDDVVGDLEDLVELVGDEDRRRPGGRRASG